MAAGLDWLEKGEVGLWGWGCIRQGWGPHVGFDEFWGVGEVVAWVFDWIIAVFEDEDWEANPLLVGPDWGPWKAIVNEAICFEIDLFTRKVYNLWDYSLGYSRED
jgi:hypothetical protein